MGPRPPHSAVTAWGGRTPAAAVGAVGGGAASQLDVHEQLSAAWTYSASQAVAMEAMRKDQGPSCSSGSAGCSDRGPGEWGAGPA